MRQLLRGQLNRSGYRALLAALRAIYEALEDELEHHLAPERYASLDLRPLSRRAALAADLAVFDDGPTDDDAVRAAVEPYVSRLRWLGEHDTTLLIAHAYVRYMGDLSGGQLIAPLVAERFALHDGAGTAFYRFDTLEDIDAAKTRFRDSLDALPTELDDSIVTEAQRAFALHEQLFEDLATPETRVADQTP